MKRAFPVVVVALLGLIAYWAMRNNESTDIPEAPPLEPTAREDAAPSVEPPTVASELPSTGEPVPLPPEDVEPPVELAIDRADEFQVQGRVITTGGASVRGARLGLYHDTKSWGLDDGIVDETASDERGRFFFPALVKFDKQVNHSYTQDVFIILATHADFGMAWKHVRPAEGHSAYVITMEPGVSKTITVVDIENNPIEGALVWPYNMYRDGSPDRKNFFSIQSGEFLFRSEETDREGKAVFTQMPDIRVSFHASKAGHARGLAFPHNDTIVLTRGATVSGRVLTDRRRPVAGATVSFSALGWNNYMRARTDSEGRYVVTDIPANGFDMSPWRVGQTFQGAYTVSLKSEDYAADDFPLAVERGERLENVDILAYSGTLVSCLVVDAETGEPLSGARLLGMSGDRRLEGYTNEEGLYEVRVIPGEVRLSITSPPEGVYIADGGQWGAEFVAEGDRVDIELELDIEGALTFVAGWVNVPADAEPSQFWVFADAGRFSTSTSGSYVRSVRPDESGSFELREVPEERNLLLYTISDDREWAGVAAAYVPSAEERTEIPSIQVEATYRVESVLTNDEGEPIPNVRLTIRPVINGETILSGGWDVHTAEDGSYSTDGILPGLEYLLWIRDSETLFGTVDGRPSASRAVVLVE